MNGIFNFATDTKKYFSQISEGKLKKSATKNKYLVPFKLVKYYMRSFYFI